MKHDVIVIGGGASGIISSIIGKDLGLDIAILEGTDRIGKKILTTGNGRCNITNENVSCDRYHSDNHNFYCDALKKFTLEDTVNFFKSIGLYLTSLENNKMYPLSLQASSVVDIFRLALDERSVPLYTNCKVKKISKSKDFNILCENGESFSCNKLIICTGGKSYPKTGSDGSGFSLVKSLGHKIVNPIPSIVQIKLLYNKLKAISGVKFDGFVDIYVNNKLEKHEFGEILFTDYGISGPPILQLSRIASYATSKHQPVYINVDLLYKFSKDELSDFLENHFALNSYRSLSNSLIGIINKKFIPIILKECGIDDIHKPCWSLEWQEKEDLISLLKGWKFEVTGVNSFDNAQVTAGGIDTTDIDPSTLESKIIKGLFFAGEVLDVDGDCGGFNLQWAWSSGATVAYSIINS